MTIKAFGQLLDERQEGRVVEGSVALGSKCAHGLDDQRALVEDQDGQGALEWHPAPSPTPVRRRRPRRPRCLAASSTRTDIVGGRDNRADGQTQAEVQADDSVHAPR